MGIFLIPIVCSVLGIIFGALGMKETAEDPSRGGRGMAIAGLVTGIVGITFWGLIVLIAAGA